MNRDVSSGVKTSLQEILAYQKNNTYRFISKNTTLYQAQEIFKDEIGKGNRIDVLLITENGKRWEGLLGIMTPREDRKSTRLNSSHVSISYAVFCLKKKKKLKYTTKK